MADVNTPIPRADADIEADIQQLMYDYPPLVKDRHAIHVTVETGNVTLTGHVQTPITRRYFLDNLARIDGVKNINAQHFYDDETIRLDTARVIPEGVRIVRSQYGSVVLSGLVPDDTTIEQVAALVQQVPGVVRVIPSFGQEQD